MSSDMISTYIALGSNLNDPTQQLLTAIDEIAALPFSHMKAISSFYQTTPLGPQDQNDFINAVMCLETSLSPHDLLHALQTIENAHGRKRERHWGPRTLDLDILLYGEQVINTESLTIPHPEMHKRNFVLVPLQEIAPSKINNLAIQF